MASRPSSGSNLRLQRDGDYVTISLQYVCPNGICTGKETNTSREVRRPILTGSVFFYALLADEAGAPMTMSEMTLPGLVDVHTHLRVPGGEHKEDFDTGSSAALAGGIVTLLAMPNTSPPLTTPDRMRHTLDVARRAVRCQVGLFAGASREHLNVLPSCAPYAAGLKIYLNDTFGPLRVDQVSTLRACFQRWPRDKMIALHAEKQSVAVAIGMSAIYDRPIHLCHISRKQEIELIADAKMAGLAVTCEVTPHHLFLTQADLPRLGPLGDMRPVLGSDEDVAALWHHLNDTIDIIATDHAPHSLHEKHSADPPPGVPGLETSLPLMLTAIHDDKLSLDRLAALMAHNPRRIFDLPDPPDTYIVVDPDAVHRFPEQGWRTRADWSPFAGMEVRGRLQRVVFKGQTVFLDGQLLAAAGEGETLFDA
jgi:dihydroorotase